MLDQHFKEYDFGAKRYHATGETLTDADVDALKRHDAILLGAIGDPRITDPRSPYQKVSPSTKANYDSLTKRVMDDRGEAELATLKGSTINEWHDTWAQSGRSMAHALVTMLRMVFGFGATVLEDRECERLSMIMHKMKFEPLPKRTEVLTLQQATDIIAKAYEFDAPSIALAQAFQTDFGLHQKDVIGEWIPIAQPGPDDITDGRDKWVRGLRWDQVDADLVLRHPTEGTMRLKEGALVSAELAKLVKLGALPTSGPIIVHERTKLPYRAASFRRLWRLIADNAGVPKDIRNMDSRREQPADADTQAAGRTLN